MAPQRTSINALMDQASAGDHQAFSTLASAVQDDLFRLALAHGLGREDAAEATQETLLRAYTGRRRWNRGADAIAWLRGILVNVVRESCRRRQRNTLLAEAARRAAEGGDARSGDEAWGPEQLRQLREAINQLPPRQREAIACRYLRRLSIKETAEAMGCAEGTVKSAVSAALERLKEILQKVS
jgi:RNA polymerase sigma-70 factor (ECF subfamily)